MEFLHFADLLKHRKCAARRLRTPGEEEARRIEAAVADRRVHTARATTRHCCVHESAMRTHECPQVFTSAGQALAKRSRLYGQHVGGIFALQLEHVTQDVRDAVIAIETEQHCLRAADFDLFLKQGQVSVAGWGGQRFSKSTGEL